MTIFVIYFVTSFIYYLWRVWQLLSFNMGRNYPCFFYMGKIGRKLPISFDKYCQSTAHIFIDKIWQLASISDKICQPFLRARIDNNCQDLGARRDSVWQNLSVVGSSAYYGWQYLSFIICIFYHKIRQIREKICRLKWQYLSVGRQIWRLRFGIYASPNKKRTPKGSSLKRGADEVINLF